MVEDMGYDALTPVEVSVFPDTTLSRGGVPSSLWQHRGMKERFKKASPKRSRRAVIVAGSWIGGRRAPFEPVWNRALFTAAKQAVRTIPVFAVGGIRTPSEAHEILESGAADMVGVGRPFYAEPDLARHFVGESDGGERRHCLNSNHCVPAQMLGMKGACYNPEVIRRRGRATQP